MLLCETGVIKLIFKFVLCGSINVEMNRNARILQRSFDFDDPTERPTESADGDDRVQAAINQAIHGNSWDYIGFILENTEIKLCLCSFWKIFQQCCSFIVLL